jgi:hypothetical protein
MKKPIRFIFLTLYFFILLANIIIYFKLDNNNKLNQFIFSNLIRELFVLIPVIGIIISVLNYKKNKSLLLISSIAFVLFYFLANSMNISQGH